MQAILQLAESGYFRQKVFKEQAKFAWSDVYEEHFDLPRARIAMITNRRVLMLLVRQISSFAFFFGFWM